MPDENIPTSVESDNAGGLTAGDTADSLPQATDAEYAKLIGVREADIKTGNKIAKPVDEPADSDEPDSDDAADEPARATKPNPDERPNLDKPAGVQGKKPHKPRDMTGFDEHEQAILQRMSNEAFAEVAPRLRKLKEYGDLPSKYEQTQKELEEARRASWSDHPKSYKLTEEYEQISTLRDQVTQVEKHYRQQLAAVRGGAKSYTPKYVDAQGVLVDGQPRSISPTSADEIFEIIQQAKNDQQTLDVKEGEIKAQHSQRYTGKKQMLDELYKTHFAPRQDVIGAGEKKWLESFPAFFRVTPEARLLAAQMAVNEYNLSQMQATNGKAKVAAASQRAAKNGSPTRGDLATDVPASSNNNQLAGNMSVEQFKRTYKI